MSSDVVNWLTWLAAIVPLWAIAWSAYHYVTIRKKDEQDRRYSRVANLLGELGQNTSVVSKVAAAYELRKYPEYAEVIIRVCDQVSIDGSPAAVKMLKDELNLTANFMKRVQGARS